MHIYLQTATPRVSTESSIAFPKLIRIYRLLDILFAQLRFALEANELPAGIGVAVLECHLAEEDEEDGHIELLEADFFDDECVVIVYRLRGKESGSIGRLLSFLRLILIDA